MKSTTRTGHTRVSVWTSESSLIGTNARFFYDFLLHDLRRFAPPHSPQPPRESTVIVFSVKFFIHTFPPSAPRQIATRIRAYLYFFFELLRSMKRIYTQHTPYSYWPSSIFDPRPQMFSRTVCFLTKIAVMDKTLSIALYRQASPHVSLAFHSRCTYLYLLRYTLPVSFYLPLFCVFVAFLPRNFLLNVFTSSFLRETNSFLKITLSPIIFYVL